jgi:purine nucleosidase
MMKMLSLFALMLFLFSTGVFSQKEAVQKQAGSIFPEDIVKPRMRIIIDNDFGGDPDGLFQIPLTHQKKLLRMLKRKSKKF